MYDNQHIDISGEGLDALRAALRIFLPTNTDTDTIEGFMVDPEFGLILFWTNPTAIVCPQFAKFPVPLTAEDLAPIIFAWLASADYGKQPDHDGDNYKGWRLYNDHWAQVANRWEAKLAVKPMWMMAGK